jgi:hypothetical protein
MNTLITFILGIVAGLFLSAQTKALHLPVIHLPHTIHLDPLAILLAIIVILAVMSARGKRTGGKS